MSYATTRQQQYDAEQRRFFERCRDLAVRHPGCWIPGAHGADAAPDDGATVELVSPTGAVEARGRYERGPTSHGQVRTVREGAHVIGPMSVIRPI